MDYAGYVLAGWTVSLVAIGGYAAWILRRARDAGAGAARAPPLERLAPMSTVDDVDDPGAGHGHDSAADGGLDLTPRTPGAPAPSRRHTGRRSAATWVALAVVIVAIGLVVYQGLGNATLYFHNVDEALAQRDDLGTRSFRLQGLVRDDVREDGTTVRFTVTFNGADIAVVHRGDPPDLFRPGLPVVLEGHFAEGSTTFESNRILVKHSEEYEAENTDRITDAEDGREDGDGG